MSPITRVFLAVAGGALAVVIVHDLTSPLREANDLRTTSRRAAEAARDAYAVDGSAERARVAAESAVDGSGNALVRFEVLTGGGMLVTTSGRAASVLVARLGFAERYEIAETITVAPRVGAPTTSTTTSTGGTP